VRRIRVWVVLGLVGAAAIAFLGPMSTAVGFFSRGFSLDVSLGGPAKIVAKGAGVDVPVKVTCTGQWADVTVSVTEKNGGTVASGTTYNVNVPCVGGIQTQIVRVNASAGKVFKKGTASATAHIEGYGNGVFGTADSAAVIGIVTK
jgi:hypothetical protein